MLKCTYASSVSVCHVPLNHKSAELLLHIHHALFEHMQSMIDLVNFINTLFWFVSICSQQVKNHGPSAVSQIHAITHVTLSHLSTCIA